MQTHQFAENIIQLLLRLIIRQKWGPFIVLILCQPFQAVWPTKGFYFQSRAETWAKWIEFVTLSSVFIRHIISLGNCLQFARHTGTLTCLCNQTWSPCSLRHRQGVKILPLIGCRITVWFDKLGWEIEVKNGVLISQEILIEKG